MILVQEGRAPRAYVCIPSWWYNFHFNTLLWHDMILVSLDRGQHINTLSRAKCWGGNSDGANTDTGSQPSYVILISSTSPASVLDPAGRLSGRLESKVSQKTSTKKRKFN
jgi:hypothetical protein